MLMQLKNDEHVSQLTPTKKPAQRMDEGKKKKTTIKKKRKI